jgi:hypothetical protein
VVDLVMTVKVLWPSEGSFRLAAWPETDEFIGHRRAERDGISSTIGNKLKLEEL